MFDEHAKRHQRWEKRDMEFLARYSVEDVRTVSRFMTEFNGYLEEQIETITGTQAEGMIFCNRNGSFQLQKKESCRQDSHVLRLHEM